MFLRRDGDLRGHVVIQEGQVTLRGSEELAKGRIAQMELSAQRLQLAKSFSDELVKTCPWIRLAAISGSTAYATSRPDDDVDFFLVTTRNRLWITLLIAMILARLRRLKSPASPQFCFNRVSEDRECREEFRSVRDPLFAREALNLRVLAGQDHYRDLLSVAPWIGDIFPRLYSGLAAEDTAMETTEAVVTGRSRWWIANAIALIILAPYLMTVGPVRNHRLLRHGLELAQFHTVLRRGFFAYESNKYEVLRERYSRVF